MPSLLTGFRELDLLVHEFLHVHNEHARATAEGVRRGHQARLLELSERFERALTAAVPDASLRRAWREHLHQRGPAPEEPRPAPRIAFRGRSDAGSELVARETHGGELEARVDGALLRRGIGLDLRYDRGAWLFHANGLGVFRETVAVSAEALEALRAWVDNPGGEPPWQHLRELAADGLIDRHVALTPRGRRAIGRAIP